MFGFYRTATYPPKNSILLRHNCLTHSMPHPLSHKRPTHIHVLNITLYAYAEIFHMVNIDVPAGVGAPPVNTSLPHHTHILTLTCPLAFLQNILPVKESANYVQGPLLALPPLELWSLFFIHIFSLLERRGKASRGEEWGGERRKR